MNVYAFDERNPHWRPDDFHNLAMIKTAESWAVVKCKHDGRLLESDVLRYLGFGDGHDNHGWVRGKNAPIFEVFSIQDKPHCFQIRFNSAPMRGRRPKDPSKLRSVNYHLRMTQSEYGAAVTAAEAMDISVADLFRLGLQSVGVAME